MSIQDRISELEAAKKIFLLAPLIGHGELKRCVYVSEEVIKLVHEEAVLSARLARVGMKTRSVLDSFTLGKRMSLGMNPYDKSFHCEIAKTGPESLGILSLRIRDPKPQLRIFGAMATKNVFIGLLWRERSLIDRFPKHVKASRAEWDALFPRHLPVISEKPDDYLSDHFLV